MEKATEQIGLRVTKSLRNRIEAQAEREKRSMSNLIVKVMIEYLEKAEQEGSVPG